MDKNKDRSYTFLGKDKALMDRIYSFRRMREQYEPLSYVSRRAYEGKHFTYWNRTAGRLEELPTKKQFFNQLPEVAKQTDAYENFLVSTDFVFTMIPSKLSKDEAVTQARSLSLLAKNYHNQLREQGHLADIVHNALLDNVAFIEVTPNDQLTDVKYRTYDMFDVLFNPTIKIWDEQKLVVKIVKRTVSELRASKLYHLPPNYKSPGIGDFNSWKDIYMVEKYSQFVSLQPDETLLFECYIIETDKHGNEYLCIRTIDGNYNVLRDDKYPHIKHIPIRPFRVFSGEWYQPSYVYRLIPLNRTIDTLANRLEELVLKVAKGGWVVQEEEEIDGGMNDEVGQIVRYSQTPPMPIQNGTIPNFLPEFFNMTLGLSERYGMNSIHSGGLPMRSSGLRAGKMIDQMTALAAQNNTVAIDNLRSALKQVLEFTFMFLYEMWKTPQDVLQEDIGEDAPAFISGKTRPMFKGKEEGGSQELITIPASFKKFQVDIDNGLGYTLEARKEMALKLNQTIDPETQKPLLSGEALKKLFNLGSSGYMMEAEEHAMFESPEFKQLFAMAQSGQLDPVQTQALLTILKTLGGQYQGGVPGMPTDPTTTGGMPNGMADTTGLPTDMPEDPLV